MKKYICLLLLMLPITLMAQKTVKGVVMDDSNFPLPGATILIKGTNKGEVTNMDGEFTITLDSTPSTLVVSFLGYVTKEVPITNQNSVTVVLVIDQQQLDEVVVVGYGTVDKKDVTGSISTINPTEEILEQSRSIEDVLRGRSAGVQVNTNSAEPGGSVSVRIRGLSSLTGSSEPLYVVDGIIMDSATEDVNNPLTGYSPPQGGGISGINPGDIESVQVLKDASATAIYGSRASNGVIIITTKTGIKGKARFNLTSTISTGGIVRDLNVLDTEGYVNYQNDMRTALGQEPAFTVNPDGSIYTIPGGTSDPVLVQGIDWAEDTYRNVIIKRHRLSVSGGGDNGDYYLSGGFISNQGAFPNALAKSTDFNLNLNTDLNDKLKLSTKISATYTELSSSKGPDENGGANSSFIRQVYLSAPIENYSLNNDDFADVDESIDGPRAWATDYDDLGEDIRLLGSLRLDYKLSKVFTYRIQFGADYRDKERSFWYGTAIRKGRDPNGIAGLSTLKRFRYNIDNTLMFRKRFNKTHRIDGTVGAILDKRGLETTQYSASNFADKSLRADGISFGQTFSPLDVSSSYANLVSFIGRLNYTLLDRYLFTATFRADGSSNFTKGNQWGYFPAFAFAWKVKEEAFLRDSNTISDLKFRLGYGEVGNQNIEPYRYLNVFGRTNSLLASGEGGTVIPVVPQFLSNPSLVWEKSYQYNAGVDFSLFKERLSGTVDVYRKVNSDLLLNAKIRPSSGFDVITANKADLQNEGLEISLNGDIISNDNFRWNLFANIAFNKNEILDLQDVIPGEIGNLGDVTAYFGNEVSGGTYFKQPANIFIKGRSAGLFYGYQTNGIIRTDAELNNTPSGDPLMFGGTNLRVGDVYFVDQNGDGDITEEDKTIIGDPNPDFTFSFGTSFDYKAFSLSFMFNGVYGNDIANGNMLESGYANNTSKNIIAESYYNAFDPNNNPNGSYPAVGVGGIGTDYTTQFNDRIVEDGSFLRLSYVSFGYNVPVDQINFIDSLRLTFSGQNLWLLTDYKGFDPEVDSFAYDPTRIGIDWGAFPNQRTFTFGLDVKF